MCKTKNIFKINPKIIFFKKMKILKKFCTISNAKCKRFIYFVISGKIKEKSFQHTSQEAYISYANSFQGFLGKHRNELFLETHDC